MEMTREQFMELMGLKEFDDGMDTADEMHAEGKSWWNIAKASISTMNFMLTHKI